MSEPRDADLIVTPQSNDDSPALRNGTPTPQPALSANEANSEPDASLAVETAPDPADRAAIRALLARVRRISQLNTNVILMLIGLAIVAYFLGRVVPIGTGTGTVRASLRIARLSLPFVMLLITGFYTGAAIRAYVRQFPHETATPERVVELFARCKWVATMLMLLAGVFAATGMLDPTRTLDYVAVVLPIGLLVIGRPLFSGLVTFATIVERARSDADDDQPSTA